MTFISGTLSGDKSTDLLLRSKASRSMRFFVAEPHKRYKPFKTEALPPAGYYSERLTDYIKSSPLDFFNASLDYYRYLLISSNKTCCNTSRYTTSFIFPVDLKHTSLLKVDCHCLFSTNHSFQVDPKKR